MHNKFGLADAFASSLDQAFWPERWLQHEDRFAAPGFRFDELARDIAADLFVGSPEKNQTMCERSFGLLQSFESEERLRDAGLHIEDAGAVSLSTGNTKRHFGKRAGRVDRVVMAEHQELSRGPRFLRPPGDAQLIAAELLRDALDVCAALAPFSAENVTAAVGRSLFKARRFREDKPLDRG